MGIVRPKEHPQPTYDEDSSFFTLKFWHGGCFFEKMGNVVYEHGDFVYIDYCDWGTFGYLELEYSVKLIGYVPPLVFVYRKPKTKLGDGLIRMMKPEDMLQMFKYLPNYRVAEVYILTNRPPKMGLPWYGVSENVREVEVQEIGVDDIVDGVMSSAIPIVEEAESFGSGIATPKGVEAEAENVEDEEGVMTENEMQSSLLYADKEFLARLASDMNFFEDFLFGTEISDEAGPVGASTMQKEIPTPTVEKVGKTIPYEEEESNGSERDDDNEELEDPEYEIERDVVVDDPRNEAFDRLFTYDAGENLEESSDDSLEEDDLRSLHSDSDDSSDNDHTDGPIFNEATDMANPQFQLGMLFSSKKILKQAIKEYSVKNARGIKIVQDDLIRVRAKCHGAYCWTVYARVRSDGKSFRVQTFIPDHTCALVTKNRFVTASYLVNKYLDMFRKDPGWPLSAFEETVRVECGVSIRIWTYYRVRDRCQKWIEGNNAEQFKYLVDYIENLRESNPGSTIVMRTTMEGENRVFERVYICLGALKEGFRQGCRRVLGLHGCHLKSDFGGHILSAVGLDADNSMYPLAYAVVESECKDSWNWFMSLLIEDAGVGNSHGWLFISDKQKGLIDALQTLVPNAEHRFCVRHLYENYKREGYKSLALKLAMWGAAQATTMAAFERQMEKQKLESPEAHGWLVKRPASEWSKSHFREFMGSDILLNNVSESFNAAIVYARDKPIISCLERMRYYLMQRLATKRLSVEKWTKPFANRIWKIIEKNREDSRLCKARWAGDLKFQVDHGFGGTYAVDLQARTCSCRKMQLSGLPCCHAISCIDARELRVEDFVENFYSKSMFCISYAPIINLMPGPEQWANKGRQPIIAPHYKKQPGRPKKARRRQQDEAPGTSTKARRTGMQMHCKECNQAGHNKRTCPKLPKNKTTSKDWSTIKTAKKSNKKKKKKTN